MKNFLFIAAIVATIPLLAQTPKYYTKAFNWNGSKNSNGLSMGLNSNNNYIICGDTKDSTQRWSPFFLQVNANGDFVRVDRFPDSFYQPTPRQLVITPTKVFAGGFANDTAQSNTYAIQIETNGNLINWNVVDDSPFVNSGYTACRAHDGGFLIGGEIQPYDPPNGQPTHPYLVKLDSAGNKLWDTIYYQYGEPYYAWFWDMKPNPNGNGYYLLGTEHAAGYSANIILLHIDETGNLLWNKSIDLGKGEFGERLLLTNDGGFLVVGRQFDANYYYDNKGLVIKLDSSRNISWINDTAYALALPVKCAVEVADGFVLGGVSYKLVPPYDLDACVTKLNPDGSLAWQRTHDRAGEDDYTYDMLSTPDGSYLLCGRTESYDDTLGVYRADVLLLKVNCMGLQTLPQAMFINSSIDTNYLCVFQNLSQYTYPDSTDGGHYIWNFGDDTPPLQTTTDAFIPHYYPNYGSYRVSLTAIVCNDTSTYTQTINLWATGISAPLNDHLFEVLPNPAQDYLLISSQTSEKTATFNLYNTMGTLVNITPLNGNGVYKLNTANYQPGLYYYTLSSHNNLLQRGTLVITR